MLDQQIYFGSTSFEKIKHQHILISLLTKLSTERMENNNAYFAFLYAKVTVSLICGIYIAPKGEVSFVTGIIVSWVFMVSHYLVIALITVNQ